MRSSNSRITKRAIREPLALSNKTEASAGVRNRRSWRVSSSRGSELPDS